MVCVASTTTDVQTEDVNTFSVKNKIRWLSVKCDYVTTMDWSVCVLTCTVNMLTDTRLAVLHNVMITGVSTMMQNFHLPSLTNSVWTLLSNMYVDRGQIAEYCRGEKKAFDWNLLKLSWLMLQVNAARWLLHAITLSFALFQALTSEWRLLKANVSQPNPSHWHLCKIWQTQKESDLLNISCSHARKSIQLQVASWMFSICDRQYSQEDWQPLSHIFAAQGQIWLELMVCDPNQEVTNGLPGRTKQMPQNVPWRQMVKGAKDRWKITSWLFIISKVERKKYFSEVTNS